MCTLKRRAAQKSRDPIHEPLVGLVRVGTVLYCTTMYARGPLDVIFSPAVVRRSVRSAVIGEIDEEEDSNKDLSTIRAEPLKPVTH